MTVAMNAGHTGEGIESLEQVKQRFALWRAGHRRGERLPNALWEIAVRMAERHGVQQTAHELRIDGDRLKKRLEGVVLPAQTSKAAPQFVEIFVPPAAVSTQACTCIIEMENSRGGKMRVELKGLDGLADLSNAFWSAR